MTQNLKTQSQLSCLYITLALYIMHRMCCKFTACLLLLFFVSLRSYRKIIRLLHCIWMHHQNRIYSHLFKMYLFTVTFLFLSFCVLLFGVLIVFSVTAGSFNISLMHSYEVLKEQIEVFCRKEYFCSCVWRVL